MQSILIVSKLEMSLQKRIFLKIPRYGRLGAQALNTLIVPRTHICLHSIVYSNILCMCGGQQGYLVTSACGLGCVKVRSPNRQIYAAGYHLAIDISTPLWQKTRQNCVRRRVLGAFPMFVEHLCHVTFEPCLSQSVKPYLQPVVTWHGFILCWDLDSFCSNDDFYSYTAFIRLDTTFLK